jgi:hypothetical protein
MIALLKGNTGEATKLSAEQVGERFHVPTGERRHQRDEQPMGRDRAQSCGLTGVATELIDVVDRERTRQGVTESGKLRCRQGGQRSLLCWLVSQPQHEAVVAPCRSPKMTAADYSNSSSRPAAKILPMNASYRPLVQIQARAAFLEHSALSSSAGS